jgi:hypothetical protein
MRRAGVPPLLLAAALVLAGVLAGGPARARNVLLFVADGLRGGMVTEDTAPAMTALLARGT